MPKSSSSALITTGRIFYALAILGFGIQYALYGYLRRGLPLCPTWLHPNMGIAYALAALCILAGLALLTTWRTSAAASPSAPSGYTPTRSSPTRSPPSASPPASLSSPPGEPPPSA